MKIPTTIVVLALLFSNFINAQNRLSGTVTDENGAVYFATIALFDAEDSTVVKGESTDENGFFELTNLSDGTYFLETTMLGYSTFKLNEIVLPKQNGESLRIKLKEDSEMLSTVEVTAKKPLLEQKPDRLVVNVENNLTSINGNMLDVMKKVPGMLVVGDKLQMAGQRNITILINGKTTRYMDVQSLLKDMPAGNIKKVEVIHQPGAEFEAEGSGPVINIILKKNNLFGTNGSVNVGIAKGYDWKYRTGVSLSHYQGSLNVHGGLGYRDYPWYDRMDLTRDVDGDIYDQVSINPNDSRSFRANLGMDWDMDERHRIGFSSRFFESHSDNLIENTTSINFMNTELTDIELISENQYDDKWQFWTANPYYTFEIDTNGQKLEFDVNLVKINNDGFNTLTSEVTAIDTFVSSQRNVQPGNSDIITTKLDYTYPLSDDVKLQVGAKYSDAELDNDLQSAVQNPDLSWSNNELQSNHFIFTEKIYAAYAKTDWLKGKWSGTMGLRYENSKSEGYSVTLDTTLTRDISKLFPSVSLAREITKELGATVAYSYRIDRPRYSTLNPFVYYLDPFTFEKGNPNLRPGYTHSMKFNLTYEKQPFFNIEYKLNNDAMVEVTEQNDETGETNLTTVNLESFKVFNASLFFPLDFIPGITGYGGVIANRSSYDSEYLAQQFNRSKWDITGFMQANFTLPGKIESEVTGWYNSGSQEGIINSSWLYGVDVGFSKKFMNDRLKVSAGVDNLFRRFFYGDIRYANMDVLIYNEWDGPAYNFQIHYKFGNQHMKQKKGHKSSASEEINRAQKG